MPRLSNYVLRQLVVMQWNGARGKKTAPVAFVGKGVCFDSGGLSLKPSASMMGMKGDMGGAAAVTGAIMVALGGEHAGLFCNDDTLAERIAEAGKEEGEKVWRLPLGSGYDKMLKSKIADMKNIGGPNAGSITAAQFLQRFVEGKTAWAHLDIAGVAWQDGEQKALIPSWGTGWGVRVLSRLVADHYEG